MASWKDLMLEEQALRKEQEEQEQEQHDRELYDLLGKLREKHPPIKHDCLYNPRKPA